MSQAAVLLNSTSFRQSGHHHNQVQRHWPQRSQNNVLSHTAAPQEHHAHKHFPCPPSRFSLHATHAGTHSFPFVPCQHHHIAECRCAVCMGRVQEATQHAFRRTCVRNDSEDTLGEIRRLQALISPVPPCLPPLDAHRVVSCVPTPAHAVSRTVLSESDRTNLRDCMHVYTNTGRGQGQPALAGAARSRQETQEPKSSARHTTPRGCRRLQLWSRSQGLKLPSPPCRCCKVTRYASYKVNTITKTRRGSANDLPMTKVTKLETRLDTAQQRRAREGLCLSFQIGRVASAERSPAVVSV